MHLVFSNYLPFIINSFVIPLCLIVHGLLWWVIIFYLSSVSCIVQFYVLFFIFIVSFIISACEDPWYKYRKRVIDRRENSQKHFCKILKKLRIEGFAISAISVIFLTNFAYSHGNLVFSHMKQRVNCCKYWHQQKV